jgi:choline kinase
MIEDFVLLNGDTLFETAVAQQLIRCSAPVTVTIDQKDEYDDDDMKVVVDDEGQLLAIGKKLAAERVNGESIGMLAFRDVGVKWFREALDAAIRRPDALSAWYLSVVHELAQRMPVSTTSIHGLWWQEIDSPHDLERARQALQGQRRPQARGRTPVAATSKRR